MKLKTLLIFVLLVYATILFAQISCNEICIYKQNGEIVKTLIDINTKIIIEDNSFVVKQSDENISLVTKEIVSVKVESKSNPSAEKGIRLNENIIFYPNPATDYISIKGISEKSHLAIYSISGDLLISSDIYDGEFIDISILSSGIYLLKVNSNVFKLNKQ